MKSNRHIIASIFLIIFSCIQLIDLHVIGHDDANDSDCQLCIVTSENLGDDFFSVDIINAPEPIVLPIDSIVITYTHQFLYISNSYSFLNKAPPVV